MTNDSEAQSEAPSVETILTDLVLNTRDLKEFRNKRGGEEIEKAKAKINRLIVENQIKILEKVHRAKGTIDFDNATDEAIDEELEQLSNNLSKGINK